MPMSSAVGKDKEKKKKKREESRESTESNRLTEELLTRLARYLNFVLACLAHKFLQVE